jgi:hypothetical protein
MATIRVTVEVGIDGEDLIKLMVFLLMAAIVA